MNPFDEYVSTLQSAHMEVEFFKFQKAFHTHNRIIVLGNGGSNSVASHISQDYMKFHNKRVSILSDPSMITMLTNDFGYDKTCEKFLEYYVEKDTLVIIMSSGGESKNINAVDVFAVPLLPVIKALLRILCKLANIFADLVVSIVGTSIAEKSGSSIFFG